MKRLYTFGCSFTQYDWPTWADILGREFVHFENWGQLGGGNQYIFNSLSECLVKNSITENDLIAVMWTNVAREDRYVGGQWITPGNIYTQNTYDKNFVKKFADEKGYLIRDLALIHAAKKMLEQYNIPHIFMSMVPINNLDQYLVTPIKESESILTAYQTTINSIKPSIFEIVFKFNWIQRIFNKKIDLHALPIEHLTYIEQVLPEYKISDDTKNWTRAINDRLLIGQKLSDIWNENTHIANRW
jgi:hypothetical protein